MYGRYGIDQLGTALLVLCAILLFINSIASSLVFSLVIWVVFACIVFRMLSKNIYKRRRENEKFLKIWGKVKPKLTLTVRRIRDIKTHRYRRCPHCSATLRLPRKRGRHTVNCPRCRKDFKVRVII